MEARTSAYRLKPLTGWETTSKTTCNSHLHSRSEQQSSLRNAAIHTSTALKHELTADGRKNDGNLRARESAGQAGTVR